MMFDPQPWMDRGVCAGSPEPDLWFANPSNTADHTAAIQLCNLCPVRTDCIEYAMTATPAFEFGIWGGLDATQIRSLRRKAARK